MTSVEWFYQTIIKDPLGDWDYYFNQAKEMEEEQIKNERLEAYNNGYANGQKDAYTE